MARGLVMKLPVSLMTRMGLGVLFAPRTRGWGAARAGIEDYIREQTEAQHMALGLDKSGPRDAAPEPLREAAE